MPQGNISNDELAKMLVYIAIGWLPKDWKPTSESSTPPKIKLIRKIKVAGMTVLDAAKVVLEFNRAELGKPAGVWAVMIMPEVLDQIGICSMIVVEDFCNGGEGQLPVIMNKVKDKGRSERSKIPQPSLN